MYNECNMSDTSVLRVSSDLKAKLKDRAVKDGRTLEWVANDALAEYLAPKQNTVKVVDNPHGVKHVQFVEPTYGPMDDVA